MCMSKPKAPKPIASAPTVMPQSIDEAAINERDRERQRQRGRAGRQQTILAGADSAAGAPPTAPVKTAIGA